MTNARWVAVAALSFIAVPAQASDWQLAGLAIGADNRGVIYVDASSVRSVRGKIRFRSDRYLEHVENGADRILAVSEVDCSRMTVTVLRAQYYSGGALVGMVSRPREENFYSSATSDHWVTRRVCEGKFLGSAVEDGRRDSSRMFTLDWAPVAEQLAITIPLRSSPAQVAAISAAAGLAASRR